MEGGGWSFLWIPASLIAGVWLGNKIAPRMKRMEDSENLLKLAKKVRDQCDTLLDKSAIKGIILEIEEWIQKGAAQNSSDEDHESFVKKMLGKLKRKKQELTEEAA